MLLKIALITVVTVYGGHKLVQYVSPTEEELLKVSFFTFRKLFSNYLEIFQRAKE